MTNSGTRLLIAIALVAGAATAADAQRSEASGPAPPAPGTGDSVSITTGNRENNAAYNQLIGGGDNKPKKADRAATHSGAVPATAADIKVGSSLRDSNGVKVGTIVSVDSNQAVVDTGQTKIGVPLIAFGKDEKGLLLGMTADKFNALIAQAHAHSHASN